MARQRMTEADRQQYGGPEWIDLADAVAWLDELDYDRLADVENQVRTLLAPEFPDDEVTLLWVLTQMLTRATKAGRVGMLRTRLWLALIATGVDIRLGDFKPHAYAVEFERPAEKPSGDADPPSGSPESSPASTPAAQTPESETSTSA